ncbi:hypothetical protein D3C80_2059600 [compost metagenome]
MGGLPSVVMNGGQSCTMRLMAPIMASLPTRQNWWTPVRPPMVTKSSISTWPARVTLFASTTPEPTMQLWATWT